MVARAMIATCEGLVYAQKVGLDLSKVIKILSGGGAYSFQLAKIGPKIVARDYEPGGQAEYFIKDLAIVTEEAKKMKLALPGLLQSQQLYQSIEAHD